MPPEHEQQQQQMAMQQQQQQDGQPQQPPQGPPMPPMGVAPLQPPPPYLPKVASEAKRIDVISRVIFPLSFTGFNVMYWSYYLTMSYYSTGKEHRA